MPPLLYRPCEGADERLRERDLVQVLVGVGLYLIRMLLVNLLLCRRIDTVRGGYAKLCEMAASLLGALMGVRVLNSQAQHGCVRVPRMKDALDLTFELEEIVLAEVDLLQL